MSALPSPNSAAARAPTTPVEELDGVGPVRAKHLKLLGVQTLIDLLEYFPRTYRFESSELKVGELVAEQIQTARGEVVAVNYSGGPRPRFEATLQDGADKLGLCWFNAAWMRTKLHPGVTIRAQGKVTFRRGMPQIVNPKWQEVDEETAKIEEAKFRPIYPASAKLPTDAIERIVADHLPAAVGFVREWFKPELVSKRRLLPRADAYRVIHQPAGFADANRARRRIVYDELMLMQIGLGIGKRLRNARLTAPVMRVDKVLDDRIRRRFPFALTAAQQDAVYSILRDVQSGVPMNRLLQGDVGSGKTVVALYAMLVAVANKMQAVILAPTEVLAEQHYLTLSTFLRDSSVNVGLLTGRTKRAGRNTLQKQLADGKLHLAVGTQALLQEDVEFANLGLVVVDEQHKLGVRQRAALKGKGLSPHYLVMTATPIPRTLALSYFADFDVTTIDELPPGRTPIETRWLKTPQAAKAYDFIRQQVGEGRQAYVVLPQVDDAGAADDVKSVAKEFERLDAGPLRGLRLAALHGQMKADEKQAVMAAFRAGGVDVLVATTVIEVGVDVANATIMLIDNADRFGLSQLHQLRGRVGRGRHASYCLLLSDAATDAADARLNAMTATNDGFEIAELDLKLRGPGQFFGTRQHGLPEFKMADITNEIALLQQAKEDALALLDEDPRLTDPAHRHLRIALVRQFGDGLPLAQVG